jgi:hypothetical protein
MTIAVVQTRTPPIRIIRSLPLRMTVILMALVRQRTMKRVLRLPLQVLPKSTRGRGRLLSLVPTRNLNVEHDAVAAAAARRSKLYAAISYTPRQAVFTSLTARLAVLSAPIIFYGSASPVYYAETFVLLQMNHTTQPHLVRQRNGNRGLSSY